MELTKFFAGKAYGALFTFTASGVAEDITGCSISFVARKHRATTNEITKALTLVTPTSGLARVDLDSTETVVDFGNYSFQLIGTDASSRPKVFGEGTFTVKEAFA